jgi:imidazolonepropionase
MTKIALINAARILQTRTWNKGFLKGCQMAELPELRNAYIITDGDSIAEIGLMDNFHNRSFDQLVDLQGDWILPGFVDSHTHIVFARSRESEFVQRIQGKSYEEIAAAGGGILNSAQVLAITSEEELLQSAFERLNEVCQTGTVAIEIKSGYGLSPDAELKMLRVIRKLKQLWPGDIKATFLGAHAIPAEYKNNRKGYIDLIIQEMLPQIAEEGLADYCDVFCDKGFYTVEETLKILEAAAKYQLKAKIHANELANSGGVQAGVQAGALSVDHLECISTVEMEVLKNATTIGTLLPNTSFFLGIPYAPARAMIDYGLGIALASDYNPGSAPSGNMLFVLAQGCIKMKLLPEEAINAITINAAYALGLENHYGSLQVGKSASFLRISPQQSIAELPYFYTRNPIKEVWIKGQKRH